MLNQVFSIDAIQINARLEIPSYDTREVSIQLPSDLNTGTFTIITNGLTLTELKIRYLNYNSKFIICAKQDVLQLPEDIFQNVDMHGFKIFNSQNPTDPLDLVTKQYADNLIQSTNFVFNAPYAIDLRNNFIQFQKNSTDFLTFYE